MRNNMSAEGAAIVYFSAMWLLVFEMLLVRFQNLRNEAKWREEMAEQQPFYYLAARIGIVLIDTIADVHLS